MRRPRRAVVVRGRSRNLIAALEWLAARGMYVGPIETPIPRLESIKLAARRRAARSSASL